MYLVVSGLFSIAITQLTFRISSISGRKRNERGSFARERTSINEGNEPHVWYEWLQG